MSIYNIPPNLDSELLEKVLRSLPYRFRPVSSRGYILDESTNQPVALEFIPDLTPQEQIFLDTLFGYILSINDFENLPNWATWTANEVEINITNAVFNGQDAGTIKANINTQLTNITTANVSQINARLDVIRTLLGNAVDAIITIRTIIIAMGKAIIYLRNLVIKIR